MRLLPALRWFALLLAGTIVAAQAIVWFRQQSPNVVETGTAVVGAPFTLTDQSGRQVSDTDFRGKIVVLVFGWTLDPDVTPATLQLLMAALEQLGPKNETPIPVFISVDPQRDDASKIEAFSKSYSRNLVTLRGSPEAIAALTTAYRFPVTRVTDILLPGGYSLDHPAVYYVLGRDGRFRGAVPYTTDVKALAGELRKLAK